MTHLVALFLITVSVIAAMIIGHGVADASFDTFGILFQHLQAPK